MQSDSTHDPGTTPDSRSLTDLWRDVIATGDAWEHAPHSDPELHRAYHDSCNTFWERFDEAAGRVAEGHAR